MGRVSVREVIDALTWVIGRPPISFPANTFSWGNQDKKQLMIKVVRQFGFDILQVYVFRDPTDSAQPYASVVYIPHYIDKKEKYGNRMVDVWGFYKKAEVHLEVENVENEIWTTLTVKKDAIFEFVMKW